jgi:hypothetical protein
LKTLRAYLNLLTFSTKQFPTTAGGPLMVRLGSKVGLGWIRLVGVRLGEVGSGNVRLEQIR